MPPHKDTRQQRLSSQRSPPYSNPRKQRSSSLHIPQVESSYRACSLPQIQRQLQVHRIGWQLMTPYTDHVMIPCNFRRNHWVLSSVNLTQEKIYLLDPFRQEVTWEYKNKQVACLRWFIPSMLYQVEFHSNRTKDDVTYSLSKKAFRMSIMDESHRVPQQHQGGNCGAHTLRLTKYLLANKKEFD
ncbi:hypothetical protein LWI28_028168 [Acer negundo]|uniref:Ubiquitin-like protease family profile domain-containing protein n=1 Tax=Acer negundo TaxID=4023 RepID=A0AAD5NML2_ACENE|nr:hypothetical protein LWI28_028168 [Acer negundo]